MSNKNTNNRISYGQYKAGDIVMFLIIMCVCETINVLAVSQWFSSAMFSISVMLLVSLVVMVRWGWLGMIFPVADGLLYSWLLGATLEQYVVYAVGNAFVALVWFYLKIIGKNRVTSSWILTIIYAVLAYALLVLGRAVIGLFFGAGFVETLTTMFSSELLDFIYALVGLLILRRFDSMLVDQKQYLKKVAEERDTIKPAEADSYWDGYTELDSADLERLKAMDEYDSKVNFNRASLKRLKEQTESNFGGGYGENADESDSTDEDDLSRLDGE